ncbi:MAG: universal stress protein [Bacteroidota bacterium]|jgi:nucleotide-binding universal stress UspA family protein
MKTILVPTDFSNNANNALKYANDFAKAINNKIVLLHSYLPLVGKYNMISGIVAEDIAIQKKSSEKKLEKVSSKYVKVPSSHLVKIGDTIDEIIDAAQKSKSQLIIMGTHGASGLKRILFGSNTSDVISKSNIPVLAIPQRYRFKKINTIVYATDLNNTINELKHIIPIAKQLNATIEVLNLNYIYNKNEDKKLLLEKKIKTLSYKKIKLIEQKATIEQTMIEQIKKYLVKRKPELLVMFPEDKAWFDKLFISSKTEELANQIKLPLLSIRKKSVKSK